MSAFTARELTAHEEAILEVAKVPEDGGLRMNAALEKLGLSYVRYVQQLNMLIDTERAEAAEPVLVHQLRRIRNERAKR